MALTLAYLTIDRADIHSMAGVMDCQLKGLPGIFRDSEACGKVVGGSHRDNGNSSLLWGIQLDQGIGDLKRT